MRANITATSVVVEGIIIGNITASRRILLLSTARVLGDIKTPELIIQDGVILEGRCTISHVQIENTPQYIEALYARQSRRWTTARGAGRSPLLQGPRRGGPRQDRGSRREERFAPGATIFTRGRPADKLYIILEGTVEVWKDYGEDQRDLLAAHGVGHLFGEMALIDDLPRSATVIARDAVRLLSMGREDFHEHHQRPTARSRCRSCARCPPWCAPPTRASSRPCTAGTGPC